MHLPDIINSCFEMFGFFAVSLSCVRLRKDKQVKGLSLLTVAFFTGWGLWNLYYYPSLGQSISGFAALCTCVANAYWLSLIFKYRGK